MELTTQQVQKVEKYLDAQNLVYVDIRLEVLDHIVSDIENMIKLEATSFETAFTDVINKWSPKLKETTSTYFGLGYSAPKLVIQKAKKLYWFHYFFLMISYFLPFVVFTHYDLNISNPMEFNYFIILKGIILVSFVAFIYMLFSKNNKTKTTYGFILKSQSLGIVIGFIALFTFFTKLKELNGINVGMLCCFLFITFSYFNFFKRHKEEIQKHKIS